MHFTSAVATVALVAGTVMADEPVSTAFTTKVYTITSCTGDAATNCPAHATSVGNSSFPQATSTVFLTKVHTIVSCPTTVVDCPSRSTIYSTEIIPKPTTSPGNLWGNSSAVVPPPVKTISIAPVPPANTGAPAPGNGAGPGAPPAAVCTPSSSVIAITKTTTTVLTNVEYSTVAVPCPTQPAPVGTGSPSPPPPAPAPPANNQTTIPSPPLPAGAASLAGSAIFAAVFAAASFLLV